MPYEDLKQTLDTALMRQALFEARDGITFADARLPDMPLVYVNPAFEQISGYRADELIGQNCRFLQGKDQDQPELAVIRQAIATERPCLVTLRNYRRDGEMFFNELSISPVRREDGQVTHFLGIQKDVTTRKALEEMVEASRRELTESNEQLRELAYRDGLTQLFNRRFLEEQLAILFNIASRQEVPLSVFVVDVDQFKPYNDRYGHLAGDSALRSVATAMDRIFRRRSDFAARYGGDEFVAVMLGVDLAQARLVASQLHTAVHLATANEKLPAPVGVSIGIASAVPQRAAHGWTCSGPRMRTSTT